ncbi:MAG: glycosyltransferase [Deltaproteobacteria bacterium]|nr:glycosyltransferase [Deltaproteobacteria bacterium]
MKHPKISIITPSFNQGEFIKDTIESIRAQNYPNIEHIVVDGGSTDSTLDVLKSYSDLDWTSEPDNGQTDALNKGFAKATGEIVTWLNSDDWYAENVLHTVAQEMQGYDIVMGTCQITDRNGNPDYIVPNVERNWFDLLKYWVPYSIPTQPSIFFRREILDQAALGQDYYLDQDLNFCMDYDLWMRLWLRSKIKRVPQLFSYYRMYEDNKTSQMQSAEPEMSRIFRRNSYRSALIENSLSFVIPCKKIDLDLESTLGSIFVQSNTDYEVLLVDYADNKQDSKSIKNFVLEAHTSGQTPLRYVKAQDKNVTAAMSSGVHAACSLYQAFLTPGLIVNPEFCLQVCNSFSEDKAALIVPQGVMTSVAESLKAENGSLNLEGLLFAPFQGISIAIRKIALQDMGLLSEGYTLSAFMMRELFTRACHKGWGIVLDCEARVEGAVSVDALEQEQVVFQNYTLAQLVTDCSGDLVFDPFTVERVKHGMGLLFDEELIKKSQELLQRAPKGWYKLDYNDLDVLKDISKSHSSFAPVWFYLSRKLQQEGANEESNAHWKEYEKTHALEAQ